MWICDTLWMMLISDMIPAINKRAELFMKFIHFYHILSPQMIVIIKVIMPAVIRKIKLGKTMSVVEKELLYIMLPVTLS